MSKVTFGTPRESGDFGRHVQTKGGTYTEIFFGGARIGYIEKYMMFSWTGWIGAYVVWGLEPKHKARGRRPGYVQKPWGATTSERWFYTHGDYGDVYPGARSALAAAKRYARDTLRWERV